MNKEDLYVDGRNFSPHICHREVQQGGVQAKVLGFFHSQNQNKLKYC